MVHEENYPFPPSILHRPFLEIVTNSQYRQDKSQEDTIKDQQHNPCWHYKHRAWIKLPTRPMLRIQAPISGKPLISPLILLPEPLRSIPGKLYGNDANDCLRHYVNIKYFEPSLGHYVSVNLLRLCLLFSETSLEMIINRMHQMRLWVRLQHGLVCGRTKHAFVKV